MLKWHFKNTLKRYLLVSNEKFPCHWIWLSCSKVSIFNWLLLAISVIKRKEGTVFDIREKCWELECNDRIYLIADTLKYITTFQTSIILTDLTKKKHHDILRYLKTNESYSVWYIASSISSYNTYTNCTSVISLFVVYVVICW